MRKSGDANCPGAVAEALRNASPCEFCSLKITKIQIARLRICFGGEVITCNQRSLFNLPSSSARTEQFDVLISDLGLPDGSGIDLIQKLASKPPLGIALTGFGMEQDIRKSREVRFPASLGKTDRPEQARFPDSRRRSSAGSRIKSLRQSHQLPSANDSERKIIAVAAFVARLIIVAPNREDGVIRQVGEGATDWVR